MQPKNIILILPIIPTVSLLVFIGALIEAVTP